MSRFGLADPQTSTVRFHRWDFVHTDQMAHPGVLTMWAGMAAYWWSFPEYAQQVTVNLNHVYGIGGVLRDLGQDPMRVLIAARVSKIVLQAVFFVIALVYMQPNLVVIIHKFYVGRDQWLVEWFVPTI